MPCDCGSNGKLSTEFIFRKGESNRLVLEPGKLASIVFGKYTNGVQGDKWDVQVRLKTGSTYEMAFLTSTREGILIGKTGGRLCAFRIGAVAKVEFGSHGEDGE
jgi:hypothetical protein